MRKRTIDHLADSLFWYIIYLLPVVCYICLIVSRRGEVVPNIGAYFTDSWSLGGLTDLVSNALESLFGESGILPLAGASIGIPVFSWYVGMMIIHLAVDFLLFIPRLCHKWMDKFCKE